MPATLDTIDIEPVDRFRSAFKVHDGKRLNGQSVLLRDVRKEALARFEEIGFPARKSEAYKYTNIQKVVKRNYALLPGDDVVDVRAEDLEPFQVPGLDAHTIVLVNGRFHEELSSLEGLQDGVIVTGFARAAEEHPGLVEEHFTKYASYEDDGFVALNTAFVQDGVFVYVPKGTVVEKPIHIISVVSTEKDIMLQPRYLFVVEENAQVKLAQTGRAITDTRTFSNTVMEIYVGKHAHLDHYEVQDEGDHAAHHLSAHSYQEEGSVVRNSVFTFSGELVRNNLNFLPDAQHCESHLYGLVLGRDAMHVDNHTIVDHAKPDCYSSELFKHILDDTSTAVFNGRVLVRQDAQRINAYQSNKSILLSNDADMYSKPELEIYADDVECSHGATTGRLDKDAIFYLRSRGLSEKEARALMLIAFAGDVTETVKIEPLKALLEDYVTRRFRG